MYPGERDDEPPRDPWDEDDDEYSEWVTFTRRTDDPKLSWIEEMLRWNGIDSKREGSSWHAPILKILRIQEDKAWSLLTVEIDEMPDDHPMFRKGYKV